MKRKGFTLVELLVVIAIIALLMGILMPALARVKQLAYQMVCGSNLSGLGKSIMIYIADFDDDFPRSGGPGGSWAESIADWEADYEIDAYDIDTTASPITPGEGTVTASLYLLVKYSDVTPAQFLCKGDEATAFVLSDHTDNLDELEAAWDFGPYGAAANQHKPSVRVSYSYHQPFGTHTLNALSSPGMAVLADRNPFIESPFYQTSVAYGQNEGEFWYEYGASNPTQEKYGNGVMHQNNGQNVLFLDSSVRFEDRVFCGVNNDNIYAPWDTTLSTKDDARARGLEPEDSLPDISDPTAWEPASRTDSFLVHETAAAAAVVGRY